MTVLDKIKSFFKRPKLQVKAPEKKAVEPAETKAAEIKPYLNKGAK